MASGQSRPVDGPWGDLSDVSWHTDIQSKKYGGWMLSWVALVLPRRETGTPVAQWRASHVTGSQARAWRLDTAGLGYDRPVLFRFTKEVIAQATSFWAHATTGQWDGSVYRTPQEAEQASSKGWDKVPGTTEEFQFVEHWLSFVLELWPDELHMTQRLIEGWRDAALARAVWNNNRKEGGFLVDAAWCAAAGRLFVRKGWATYHLRLGLAVTMGPEDSLPAGATSMQPALPSTICVLGRCISQLVRYMKHNPDNGRPLTAVEPNGPLAAAYSQLSACWTGFCTWLLGTLVLPDELGHRLHLHVLAGPMMNALVHSPWLSSRSAEIFEHGFYKDCPATHVAACQALSTLALHRWRSSAVWHKWGATAQQGSAAADMQKRLRAASAPMLFPVVPSELVRYRGGVLWVRLQRQLAPIMQMYGLVWAHVGGAVWVPVPKSDDVAAADVRAAVHTHARSCADAVQDGLRCVKVKVGAPNTNGRKDMWMPRIAAAAMQEGSVSEHLCTLVAAVTSPT